MNLPKVLAATAVVGLTGLPAFADTLVLNDGSRLRGTLVSMNRQTVVFDEDTPLTLIMQIQPDVLVKGADWAADEIVGRDVVEARGGRVVRMPIEAGFSTTGE